MHFTKSETFCKQIFAYRALVTLYRTLKYERPDPVTPCTRALKHFDSFYKSIFKKKWPSVRLGLLSDQKQIAIVNNFGNVDETNALLQNKGAFNLQSFFNIQKSILQEKGNKLPVSKNKSNLIASAVNLHLEKSQDIEKSSIYPPDKNVDITIKLHKEEDLSEKPEEDHPKDENIYDIEDTMSSMSTDLSMAKIDSSRIILPNEESNSVTLHEFVPATKLRGLDNYISESEYYKYYQPKSEVFFNIEPEISMNFPEKLAAYVFDRGDISKFSWPIKNENDIYDYLIMDGADLLTVLALGLQPGDAVLDIFPNSGNRAFCILQTLLAKFIICNSNTNVKKLFQNYLPDFSDSWEDMLLLTSIDMDDPFYENLFDKIIVDVDCTDDRKSLSEVKNNYFSPMKLREKIKLPEKQSLILTKALTLVKPGGTVLYTTTTMSPIQNDAVVRDALKITMEETNFKFVVKDLEPALSHTKLFFNFANYLGLKYGTLVAPFLPSNFGPRYFSKIIKQS